MKPIIAASCPLCGNDAQYYSIDFEHRRYFNCPSCSRFIVTQTAESHLRSRGTHPDIADRAKAVTRRNDEEVLEASFDSFGEQGLSLTVVRKSTYPSI